MAMQKVQAIMATTVEELPLSKLREVVGNSGISVDDTVQEEEQVPTQEGGKKKRQDPLLSQEALEKKKLVNMAINKLRVSASHQHASICHQILPIHSSPIHGTA